MLRGKIQLTFRNLFSLAFQWDIGRPTLCNKSNQIGLLASNIRITANRLFGIQLSLSELRSRTSKISCVNFGIENAQMQTLLTMAAGFPALPNLTVVSLVSVSAVYAIEDVVSRITPTSHIAILRNLAQAFLLQHVCCAFLPLQNRILPLNIVEPDGKLQEIPAIFLQAVQSSFCSALRCFRTVVWSRISGTLDTSDSPSCFSGRLFHAIYHQLEANNFTLARFIPKVEWSRYFEDMWHITCSHLHFEETYSNSPESQDLVPKNIKVSPSAGLTPIKKFVSPFLKQLFSKWGESFSEANSERRSFRPIHLEFEDFLQGYSQHHFHSLGGFVLTV